jgi:hypothetical protein
MFHDLRDLSLSLLRWQSFFSSDRFTHHDSNVVGLLIVD